MTDETANLVLEHLRRMREEMREGFSDVKHRLSALEQTVANLQIQFGQSGVLMASLNKRVDRVDDRRDSSELRLDRIDERLESIDHRLEKIDGRVERIERKLDLVGA